MTWKEAKQKRMCQVGRWTQFIRTFRPYSTSGIACGLSYERRTKNLRSEVTRDRDQLLKREVFEITVNEWSHWRNVMTKETSAWRELISGRLTVIETRSITWTASLGVVFMILQVVMFFFYHK